MIVITPPPVWEEKLMVSNSAKGKPLALDRTNQRFKHHNFTETNNKNAFFPYLLIIFYRTLTYVNACKDVGREVGSLLIHVFDFSREYSKMNIFRSFG